jgi:hypothetical protein
VLPELQRCRDHGEQPFFMQRDCWEDICALWRVAVSDRAARLFRCKFRAGDALELGLPLSLQRGVSTTLYAIVAQRWASPSVNC